MNETYAEVVIKRKETAGSMALRVVLIIIAVLAFFLTFTNSILLLITAIFIAGLFYLFPRLSLEYEYVYCDGQLDFDKIMGKSSRKNLLKVQFEQVVMMAPQDSHALDGYTYVQTKVKDFSSRSKDGKAYVIVTKEGEAVTKILFEPNQKMVDIIRSKYPRKVSF